jgi:hypothetical protein
MRLKLIEIINCNTVLNELSTSKSTNVRAVYKIAKISKALKNEMELVEEQRLNIIKKYCEMDDNELPKIEDGQYIIPTENTKILQQELENFLAIEADLNIDPLTLSDLEGFDLSSRQLTELFVIMEEN